MTLPVTTDQAEKTAAAAAACGDLDALEALVPACGACARLRTYCEKVAANKIKRFAGETYWGKPAPGFGDPQARILLVGLAPAAHGANRTGRLFTGDRSGDFLYAGLHRAGLCSQPRSVRRGDGLTLRDVYIGVAGRCAPPDNRPTPTELGNCRPYLARELDLLTRLRVVIPLGGIAHEAFLRVMQARDPQGVGPLARYKFGHGATHTVGKLTVIDCYHVSQQNTFTGRLTEAMFDRVLEAAQRLAGS